MTDAAKTNPCFLNSTETLALRADTLYVNKKFLKSSLEDHIIRNLVISKVIKCLKMQRQLQDFCVGEDRSEDKGELSWGCMLTVFCVILEKKNSEFCYFRTLSI